MSAGEEPEANLSDDAKKVKKEVVSRHVCVKRIHCVDIDDCRCRHDKFFSVKRVYKRPDIRLRPTDVGPIWRLVHPHLVRVRRVFEDKFWIWIVEDVVDGVDILTSLNETISLSEYRVASLSRQLLVGLKAMHDAGLVHGNLTPNKVLLDAETDAVKIADVSLNRLLGEQAWRRTHDRFPGFCPPEWMRGPRVESQAQDVWSVGIVIHMMLSLGRNPFIGEGGDNVNYKAILQGSVDFESLVASRSAKAFLAKLLVANPKARVSVDEALKHPWLDLARIGRSDVDIKVKEVEEVEEEAEEEANNCGCDISGQESLDEEFDSDEESCHCEEPPWDGVVRVGINGLNFSGIRLLKTALNVSNIAVAAVNDPSLGGDIDYLLYLMQSDSTRGPPRHVNLTYEDSNLVIPEKMGGGKQMKVYSIKSEESPVPWDRAGAEYVFDCTGNARAHLDNYFLGGAKRVIVTGSDAADFPNFVARRNVARSYNKKIKVVGAPAGVVHCLLPLLEILHESYGIHEALVTEVKSRGEQLLPVDGPTKGKTWRVGRGAGQNIIPAPSDAGKIVGDILGELKGKILSTVLYVPSHEVSVMDATLVLANGASWEHLEETFDAAAAKPEMKDIFVNIKEELVSSDFRNETCDCNLDFNSSLGISETFIKLVAWFDDEGTKFRRALDLVQEMADVDKKNVKRLYKGPTPGQKLFDELALTEATRRDQAASLDAGRTQLLTSQDSRRLTSPGALVTAEFGFKPVEAPEGEQPKPRQSDDAAPTAAPHAEEEAGGDASSTKKASVPAG